MSTIPSHLASRWTVERRRAAVRDLMGELDPKGMVCDLDVLHAALAKVADEVRDADLERIRPDDAEAVTVEVFARWAHGQLAGPVKGAGGEVLTVRVWESSEAFGGYQGPV